ncbi:hypothetical protein N9P82_00670 [bacterium]|nr:hypothetical protein [bacterium]
MWCDASRGTTSRHPPSTPHGEFILITVWAIILTSCFVYRHTAGREYEDLLEGISLFLFPYGQID